MVICKNCNKYFKYQWEWDTFTYGAFQKCPHCRTTTFISSHNFWRVFSWNLTMFIIILEMILAPLALYLFYPFRLVDHISFPLSGLLENIPDDVIYTAIFAIFAAVWCLNLFPSIRDQYLITKAFKDSNK
jgi:hypothetical protein